MVLSAIDIKLWMIMDPAAPGLINDTNADFSMITSQHSMVDYFHMLTKLGFNISRSCQNDIINSLRLLVM